MKSAYCQGWATPLIGWGFLISVNQKNVAPPSNVRKIEIVSHCGSVLPAPFTKTTAPVFAATAIWTLGDVVETLPSALPVGVVPCETNGLGVDADNPSKTPPPVGLGAYKSEVVLALKAKTY